MNFFGKKKSSPASSGGGGAPKGGNPQAALTNMKTRIAAVEKRIEFLEKKAHAALVEAKRLSGARNKTGAMTALKRKKMHEKEIAKLRTAVFNLESQAMAIEGASTNIDIVEAMRHGKKAQEEIAKKIDIDKVTDLQDDINEHMQMQDEVDNLLGEPLGDAMDDDDLLAELNELDEEDAAELENLEADLGTVAIDDAADHLPAAPSGRVRVPAQANAEDDDAAALAALEAEMAM